MAFHCFTASYSDETWKKQQRLQRRRRRRQIFADTPTMRRPCIHMKIHILMHFLCASTENRKNSVSVCCSTVCLLNSVKREQIEFYFSLPSHRSSSFFSSLRHFSDVLLVYGRRFGYKLCKTIVVNKKKRESNERKRWLQLLNRAKEIRCAE